LLIINIYKKFGRKNSLERLSIILIIVLFFFCRHPFLLYPHFIDHWKKRLNDEEDDFLDDSEFEAMFTDEDEEMKEKNKKKKKEKKVI